MKSSLFTMFRRDSSSSYRNSFSFAEVDIICQKAREKAGLLREMIFCARHLTRFRLHFSSYGGGLGSPCIRAQVPQVPHCPHHRQSGMHTISPSQWDV